MKKYVLAHDLGTSGNKATLYDFEGNLCSSVVYEYDTFYPDYNWVEQDPEDWWKAVCITTRQLIEKSGISSSEIYGVCFSAQMMGCLMVDRSGNPLRRMIIWADQRAVQQADYMEKAIGMRNAYSITGHRISAAYSAAKILWVKENEPDIYNSAYKILNAKDYIIYKLTGTFATDYSDASGTNMFDIGKKIWSAEIVNSLGISMDLLPELHASTDIVGHITSEASGATGLVQGTPVIIGGGDGACAAVGAGAVEEGKAYNVIGSSSWIALAAKKPVFDEEMRTFNWVHLDKALYSPCGTMQTAAYSLTWLKNNLCDYEIQIAKDKNISPYSIIDSIIEASQPGANSLLFLPYLLGERSPRWNPDAKGAFIGLKMDSTKADIYRSVLEGVGYNLKVILEIFDKNNTINELTIIGGGAKSKVWLQILSDILGKPLLVPKYIEEATSMGAAICGGIGIGVFNDFKVIQKFNKCVHEVKPRLEYRSTYDKLFNVFNKAYEALIPVYKELNK